ncbi:MAG: 30S ribosomal protein S8 [Mycoplasma sp.]
MTDPIANLVVRLKNANKAKLPSITFNSSNLIASVVEVLQQEGYIQSYKVITKKHRKIMMIVLKYKNLIPTINGIRQISKPGLRVYQEAKKLPRVLHGLGIAIVSTSQGVMTDKKARKLNLGGEVLVYVW